MGSIQHYITYHRPQRHKPQDYNTHLVQTQDEMLEEATHSYSSSAFLKIFIITHLLVLYQNHLTLGLGAYKFDIALIGVL